MTQTDAAQGEVTLAPAVTPATRPTRRPASAVARLSWRARTLWVVAVTVIIGALAGGAWRLAADPPVYRIAADGGALITERALSRLFAIDAWFLVIALLFGLGLGTLLWYLLGSLGWPSVVIALVAGFVAGWVCWQVGEAFGPSDFAMRLAQAKAGETVPMDFALRARSALVVWPIGTLIPVALYATSEAVVARRRRASSARAGTPVEDT